jgi:predicted ferric reductase
MSTLLYILAVILVIGWSLGYFVYSAGSIIHTLLMLAIITTLLGIILGKNPSPIDDTVK